MMLILAVALNAGLFGLLLWHTIREGSTATWATLLGVFVVSFVFENVYRQRTGRTLRLETAPDTSSTPDTGSAPGVGAGSGAPS